MASLDFFVCIFYVRIGALEDLMFCIQIDLPPRPCMGMGASEPGSTAGFPANQYQRDVHRTIAAKKFPHRPDTMKSEQIYACHAAL
jgi:hypothetical protein